MYPDIHIRRAASTDIDALAALRASLWPEGSIEEHAAELSLSLRAGADLLLVADLDGTLVAFLEARLRSHADGCESSPVGYLEGWFVAAAFRKRGVGRGLFKAFEQWARAAGCKELASDTWLHNVASQKAHERMGFVEVDRVVTYRKALGASLNLGPHARPPAKK